MFKIPIFKKDMIIQNCLDGKRNEYGYTINVNHAEILQIYNEYKISIKSARQFAISDKQRLIFEQVILNAWFKNNELEEYEIIIKKGVDRKLQENTT